MNDELRKHFAGAEERRKQPMRPDSIEELRARLRTPAVLSLDRVRSAVTGYERKYGCPSDRLADAFRDEDGVLVETESMRTWSMLYRSLQELEKREAQR